MMADHGASKYSNEGCRCTVCRGAWAEYTRRRRWQREAYVEAHGLPASIVHGYSAYFNWGCRCVDCTAAVRVPRPNRRRTPNP